MKKNVKKNLKRLVIIVLVFCIVYLAVGYSVYEAGYIEQENYSMIGQPVILYSDERNYFNISFVFFINETCSS